MINLITFFHKNLCLFLIFHSLWGRIKYFGISKFLTIKFIIIKLIFFTHEDHLQKIFPSSYHINCFLWKNYLCTKYNLKIIYKKLLQYRFYFIQIYSLIIGEFNVKFQRY